jgi:hypothetical protein
MRCTTLIVQCVNFQKNRYISTSDSRQAVVDSHATALILIHYPSSRNIFRTFRDQLLEQADKDNLRIMLVRLINPHPLKTA